jgi:IS30 family transposase
MITELKDRITDGLNNQWSPEQIQGRLKKEEQRSTSLFEKTKPTAVACISIFDIRSISKEQESQMHEARSETALASKIDLKLWIKKYV